MTKTEFVQARKFIASDIGRELQLARVAQRIDQHGDSKARAALTELSVEGGGGNWLAALGLLCYTEFGGRLKFALKKGNGGDAAGQNFDAFFKELGANYGVFLGQVPNVYSMFRCGLAHEYYAKGELSVYMLDGPTLTADPAAAGLGVDPTQPRRWYFCVERYFRDLMSAFDRLENGPWPPTNVTVPTPTNAYGDTWFPPSELFATSLEMHYASLATLHGRVDEPTAVDEKKLESEFASLAALRPPGDEHLDSVIDDILSLQSQVRWSALLQIVAIYQYLEAEIVLLMRWRFSGLMKPEVDILIRQVHQWDRLKELTRDHCGTQLSSVANYTNVDELRVLANAVKHTAGLISKDVANRKGKTWEVGKPIDTTKLDLPSYRTAAVAFLSDLVKSAESCVTNQFGPPPK